MQKVLAWPGAVGPADAWLTKRCCAISPVRRPATLTKKLATQSQLDHRETFVHEFVDFVRDRLERRFWRLHECLTDVPGRHMPGWTTCSRQHP
eukprot:4498403-Amphidinium_carterae.1